MTRAPSASAYDDDFFAWTQEQAAALRRLPTVAEELDIMHVAEEIEDLGKRDLREVVAYLGRLFEHLFKIAAAPNSRDVPHWRGEAIHFQMSAAAAFSPGMRQLIDLQRIWRQGRKRADIARGSPAQSMTDSCPFTLDELLSDAFDLHDALRRAAAPPPPHDP